jgi:hypothetical protein
MWKLQGLLPFSRLYRGKWLCLALSANLGAGLHHGSRCWALWRILGILVTLNLIRPITYRAACRSLVTRSSRTANNHCGHQKENGLASHLILPGPR